MKDARDRYLPRSPLERVLTPREPLGAFTPPLGPSPSAAQLQSRAARSLDLTAPAIVLGAAEGAQVAARLAESAIDSSCSVDGDGGGESPFAGERGGPVARHRPAPLHQF